MDSSPKPSNNSNATDSLSSESVELQESPIFTYISNLSPIQPVKAARTPQGFPGLNSPPFVFTSPRINSRSNSVCLKRPQFALLSVAGLSGKDENFKVASTVANESGISNAQLSSGLTPCSQNAFIGNNSPPEKASSLSASTDDFLPSVVNMDRSALTCSANLTPKTSDNIPQSVNSLVDLTETEVKTEDKYDNGKDEVEIGAPLLMCEHTEDEHQVKPLKDLTPTGADEKPIAVDAPSELCPAVEPNSPIDCAFNNQHGGYSNAENAGACKDAELGCTSQLGSLQNAKEQGNCGEHTDAQCTEAGQKKMQHDNTSKVGLQQRGVRRRCLQFEDAQKKAIEKSICAHNLSGTAGFPSSPTSPEVLEVLGSSSLDKPVIPSNGLFMNQSTSSSRHSGNHTLKVPKPSGIGLHLNSIVNAMQMGSGATVSLKSAERGSLSILGKRSSSTMSCYSPKNSSMSLKLAEGVSVSSEDSRHDSIASVAASSVASMSPYNVKRLNDSLLWKPVELKPNPCDKRISSSENADSVDDFCPSSPKKKRNKTLDNGDSNGCKRCNCKKTKCLKLYCDCFAAGIYCAEPCACQGCFNRPEYEDTVLETRQQIESRNPLAFAPKIIQHITEPPASSSGDDGTRFTPASARHKRGCNCKKSKCLKKYCECYQSNVGCSDGCRCEGCENMYGRKAEYSMIKDLVSKHSNDEIMAGSFDKKLELVAPGDSLLHNELCNPHNMTPLTPSFECSNHGKAASKSWFSSGRNLPSPESCLNFLASYGMSPGPAMNPDNQGMTPETMNPDNHGVTPETNNAIMDLVSFDQELEYGSGDTMNQFSPGFDGTRNPGYLSAMPNPQNAANIMRTQMFPGNYPVLPASSLRWRSSPISPMSHFGGTKLLEVADFGGRLYGMLDDDTPEILKETPTQSNAVKVSSPNKKRVSPPHESEIGSSSLAGLRSGRKFILQAVPSFPPLTPCIDSKVYAGPEMNDSQDCSKK